MPSVQRGQIRRRGPKWSARYYDEAGRRRERGGFLTRKEASQWLSGRLTAVQDVREGRAPRQPDVTLAEFVETYLAAHAANVSPRTLKMLRSRLRPAIRAFGERTLAELEPMADEIAAWRAGLPEGARYGYTSALKQTLEAAVRWGRMRQNPAKLAGPNPQPKRSEIVPLTLREVARIARELGRQRGALVYFAAETGLRPGELIALERKDVHRDEGVVLVERVVSDGELRPYGKTDRSRRRVPLSDRALMALDRLPPRLETRLLFPAPEGGHLDWHNFAGREFRPAVKASGLDRNVRPYDLRHTFASNALAARLTTFELARVMGTSVAMIDARYGHLVRGSEDAMRERLNTHAAVWGQIGGG